MPVDSCMEPVRGEVAPMARLGEAGIVVAEEISEIPELVKERLGREVPAA
jgi:hypothetical protein